MEVPAVVKVESKKGPAMASPINPDVPRGVNVEGMFVKARR